MRVACALGLALLAAATLPPRPAAAQPAIQDVLFVTIETQQGWFFEVEVEGAPGITATFTPPGGTAIPIPAGPDFLEFEDGPFPTRMDLEAVYPTGSYGISINAGQLTATLPFDPVEPDGEVSFTSPTDGQAGLSPAPTVEYGNTCTNCLALLFELEAVGGGLELEAEPVFDVQGSGSLPYADFQALDGMTPPALPDGTYRLFGSAAAGSITPTTFDQGSTAEFEFESIAARERETAILFTVPEPGAASGLAALGALALLARRPRARRGGSG